MAIAVWRICHDASLSLPLLPYGSTLGLGRWHVPPPVGMPVVYSAASRALAQLEKRVHANGVAPANQSLICLVLPDSATVLHAHNDLGLDMQGWQADEAYTQGFGLSWLRTGDSLGLWVPSVVEPRECNLLLNPAHRAYARIKVEVEMAKFEFDRRLF